MCDFNFPLTVFTTSNLFEDYSAPDMKYGDLSECQLKNQYGLFDISDTVNPFEMTRRTPFDSPRSMFANVYGETVGKKLSVRECSNLLFDEMRNNSFVYSMVGPYSHIIKEMINNLQSNHANPYRNFALNIALRKNILKTDNRQGTLGVIKNVINKYLDREKFTFPKSIKSEFYNEISKTRLPKYIDVSDNFNGLGISVHDITATKIIIKGIKAVSNGWSADIHYVCQDHFGLDDSDILKMKFKQHKFFRIWFVLQRYKEFGFKPFMTNMESTVTIGDDF
ncbi:YPO3983 family protein [Rouxiella sp. Mn2063]|uniref:YPO3983 family protein n=1 Tax=Rouxiella sp. Mn2063 TaxID=3395262 RepID=UPI003BDB433D